MNSTSVERAFNLTVSGPPQSGVFEWNANNDTFIWRPVGSLPPTVLFSINTGARDRAGNHLVEEYTWRLGPPSPPDPLPVFAMVGLLIAAVALLLLFLHRRSRMRCKSCKRPITQGEQCRECREKDELEEKGKMEDGILIVEPSPPGPNADFGEPEQAGPREEDIDETGVAAAGESEGDVGVEDAASALAAAESADVSNVPARPVERFPSAPGSVPAPKPTTRAPLLKRASPTRAPEPSFVPESPVAPSRPEVRLKRRVDESPSQEPEPARGRVPAPSALDQRPPGRVAVAPVVRAPQAARPPPSMVARRSQDEERATVAAEEKSSSAKDRLERIRKMREARGGK